MKVLILETKDKVARAAADIIEDQIRRKPTSTLGLATGNTPVHLYEELVRRHVESRLSFAQVSTFNLDEYIGYARNHKQSYSYYMNEHLFSRVDLVSNNTFLPSCPDIRDQSSVCQKFENKIRDCGGIDLQILGIGSNGHIGFNEPSSSFGSRTRVKTLMSRTVRDNGLRLEPGKSQPRLAITMGIATILDARRIVMMATGEIKASAVASAIEGPVSAICPATSLQFHHDATAIVDEEAAAQLRYREYYKSVDDIDKSLPVQESAK